jgi:hypothetical protein
VVEDGRGLAFVAERVPDQSQDLPRPRVTAERALGEQRPAIEGHLEYAPAGGRQGDVGPGIRLTDRCRQTDGPWFVVSDGAVFDVEAHGKVEEEG